ncbi:MAG: YggT family protein [Spirochaetaceae bacterium]|nr:YggT family protein [Spirochaetaceae bacterium]
MRIFGLLSAVVSLYTMMCFVRIILTWIPSLNYSKFGSFMSTLCDPYMNYFRRFRFLQFRNIDFSPILSIGLLVAVSNIFSSIAMTGRFSIGYLLASVISILWSVVASVVGFLIILLIIRLVALFLNKNGGSLWYSLDNTLNPIVYKIAGVFRGKNTFMTQKTAYIITIIALFVARFLGNAAFSLIAGLLTTLPF